MYNKEIVIVIVRQERDAIRERKIYLYNLFLQFITTTTKNL